MSVPYWPSDLPQRVLREGYGEAAPDGRLFKKMDKGPSKVRRRFSSAITPVSATIVVTHDGLALFGRFWDEDLDGGALPFLIPAQRTDGRTITTSDGSALLDADGLPMLIEAWWLVRFGEAPPAKQAISDDPSNFRVSFDLEVLP